MTTISRSYEEIELLIIEAYEKGYYTSFDLINNMSIRGIPIKVTHTGIIVINFEYDKSSNSLNCYKKNISFAQILHITTPYPTTEEWKRNVDQFMRTKKEADNLERSVNKNDFKKEFEFKPQESTLKILYQDIEQDVEFEESSEVNMYKTTPTFEVLLDPNSSYMEFEEEEED